MNYRDDDLTFYLNTKNDAHLLPRCLASVRRVYPGARIVIRSDDDADPRLDEIAEAFQAEFFRGDWLFSIDRGGEVVHEMLRLCLKAPCRWLFKIDPDTRVHHRFHKLPAGESIFGTVQQQGGLFSIQGGCVGFTHGIARQLMDSGFFMDPDLAECPPPWAINQELERRPVGLGLTSFDWLVGWAARMHGTELLDWPEILSEWLALPQGVGDYAITHPHKPGTPPDNPCVTSLRHVHPDLLVASDRADILRAPHFSERDVCQ